MRCWNSLHETIVCCSIRSISCRGWMYIVQRQPFFNPSPVEWSETFSNSSYANRYKIRKQIKKLMVNLVRLEGKQKRSTTQQQCAHWLRQWATSIVWKLNLLYKLKLTCALSLWRLLKYGLQSVCTYEKWNILFINYKLNRMRRQKFRTMRNRKIEYERSRKHNGTNRDE